MSIKVGLLGRAGAFAGAIIAITTLGNYLVSAAPWEKKTDFEIAHAQHEKRFEKMEQKMDGDTQTLLFLTRGYWVGQKEQAEDELKKSPDSPSAKHLYDLAQGQIEDTDRRLQGKGQ